MDTPDNFSQRLDSRLVSDSSSTVSSADDAEFILVQRLGKACESKQPVVSHPSPLQASFRPLPVLLVVLLACVPPLQPLFVAADANLH